MTAMAFCTNCGSSLSSEARFCPNCGQNISSATTAGVTPVAPTPIECTIVGDNLQIARVRLKPGQEVYAEAGKMIYKTTSVTGETRMIGNTLGEKILGAFKRKLMGESLFLTYFRGASDGEVGFAGSYPGKIQAFDLAAGQTVIVQRDRKSVV